MANAGKTVFMQFTKVQSIHHGFLQVKMKDDSEKKLIPQLPIDSKIFTTHFQILVQFKTKGTVGVVCALLRHWQLGA